MTGNYEREISKQVFEKYFVLFIYTIELLSSLKLGFTEFNRIKSLSSRVLSVTLYNTDLWICSCYSKWN